MKETTNKDHDVQALRAMSATDLQNWGIPDVAFIKRVVVNDEVGWSIHAADGTHMGIATSRDLAFAAARQHDLEPHSVH